MSRPVSLWHLRLDTLGRCYAVNDTSLGQSLTKSILPISCMPTVALKASVGTRRPSALLLGTIIWWLAVMLSLWMVAAVFAEVKGLTLTEETVVSELRDYIAESLQIDGSAVNIRILSSVADHQSRPSALISHLGTGKPVGRVTFLIRSSRVTAEVEAVKDVVVANRFLRRNQILGEGDLRVSSLRLAWPEARYLEDPALGVGKRVTRPVPFRLPVTEDVLGEPYIIQHGSRITIEYLSGPLKILALGIAKDDGAIGSLIRVTNIDSKKELWAKIIDAETVQVGPKQ